MKRIRKDLTGKRFGKLNVKCFHSFKAGYSMWQCECDCGGEKITRGSSLANGRTQSCNCLKAERIKTHDMSYSKIYRVWASIKERCNNHKCKGFENYGGRGIKCGWDRFKDFMEDMYGSYSPGLSIDRIDNDGDYCKENCRWTTRKVQNNNCRTNVNLTYGNKTMTIAEWAEHIGVKYHTLYCRHLRGWSVRRMLTEPVKIYNYNKE